MLESSICKESFYEFVKRAWPVVEPGVTFIDNWHIKLICNALEKTTTGDIKRLAINIPPRCCKSTLISVMFPAWVLAKNQNKKFLTFSYAENLAVRDAVKSRSLINSEWYQRLFPEVKLKNDQNQKTYYETIKNGARICAGVNGAGTGFGGDCLIVDDALKADDALSDVSREAVNFWFDNTLSTRLDDPQNGVIILIGQRLHENDLFGHIYDNKNDDWEKIILPAEFEPGRYTSKFPELNDPRKTVGELLWPERLGKNELDGFKDRLGSVGYANQMQQRAAPDTGTIYKKSWFKNRPYSVDTIATYISWDTAGTAGTNSAFSSATVGGLTPDLKLVIKEVYRDKLEFTDLSKAIEKLAHKWNHTLNGVIIENKSTGISLLQTLRNVIDVPLYGFNPPSDKESRAKLASIWCENGSVILPVPDERYPWLFDFETELFEFPNGRYKDQVDSFNQLILFLQGRLEDGLYYRTRKG